MLMTWAVAAAALAVGSALRRNTGATFHCCPCSVMMVTDLRLYLVRMPVSRGWPSGWKDTRSPMRNEHLRVGAHLAEKLQARHDPVVEVDEFGFGEFVDVDAHGERTRFQE